MIPIVPVVIFISIFGLNLGKTDKTVLNMVNEIRIENKIAPVIYSKKLGQSSTRKACDMKNNNYFSHFSPNGLLWEFFTNVDYRYKSAGENLAKDCTDKDCVTLWMDSPKHKAIILDPRYKEGAVSRCGEYLALHFGSRLTIKEKLTIIIFRIKAILKQETVVYSTNT